MDLATDQPHLCFLAYFFPPVRTPAQVRAWNMATQLRARGWAVTVITPDPSLFWATDDEAAVEAELARLGISRVATGHERRWLNALYLRQRPGSMRRALARCARLVARGMRTDRYTGWSQPCLRAAASLPPGSVDLVLASGSPFLSFSLARDVARMHGCPYVLDYRDPWSGNAHVHRGQWQLGLERSLTEEARAITIVSERHACALRERFQLGEKVQVLTNGFSPEEAARVVPAAFDHPAITYAGVFYPPKSVIDPVMAALARIDSQPAAGPAPWRFHYYGPQGQMVAEVARQYGVPHRVVVHGSVPRSEVLSAVRASVAAVVVTSVLPEGGDAELGIVTSKIFEAIGLGTPVVLVAPPGSDAETVLDRTSGGRRYCGADIDGLAGYLRARLSERAAGATDGREFSWTVLGQRLDHILRSALACMAVVAIGDGVPMSLLG